MKLKIMIASMTFGILFFLSYLLSRSETTGAELTVMLSFGCIVNLKAHYGDAFFQYLMILFPQILLGVKLSKTFCNATAYFYVRTSDLRKWYLIESAKLLSDVLVYYVTLLSELMILCMFTGKIHGFSGQDALFLLYFLLLYSLFTFFTCAAVNLIAIYAESGIAFGIVECIVMICIGCYLMTGEIYEDDYLYSHSELLAWNPFCHLIIGLHKSGWMGMNQVLEAFFLRSTIPLSVSIGYMLILTIGIMLAGYIWIDKFDLLGEKMEGC